MKKEKEKKARANLAIAVSSETRRKRIGFLLFSFFFFLFSFVKTPKAGHFDTLSFEFITLTFARRRLTFVLDYELKPKRPSLCLDRQETPEIFLC
jgi:hypothetical protein